MMFVIIVKIRLCYFIGMCLVRCAHLNALRVRHLRHNFLMSRERVSVEWGFGKLKLRNGILFRARKLKPTVVDIPRLARVTALLTNAHTCLQTGLHFSCWAATLTEYFE